MQDSKYILATSVNEILYLVNHLWAFLFYFEAIPSVLSLLYIIVFSLIHQISFTNLCQFLAHHTMILCTGTWYWDIKHHLFPLKQTKSSVSKTVCFYKASSDRVNLHLWLINCNSIRGLSLPSIPLVSLRIDWLDAWKASLWRYTRHMHWMIS